MKAFLTLAAVCLFSSCTFAAMKTDTVEYKIGDKTFKGYASYDDAGGTHPGILVVPEWWGLNDYAKGRADQLAKMGYVAFVADMYGDGQSTEDAKQAGAMAGPVLKDRKLMRERVTAAFGELKKINAVDHSKLAAIGFCFGGTSVLELARDGQQLDGVIAFHAGLSNPSPDDDKNIKGKVLVLTGGADPSVTPADCDQFKKEMTDAGVDWELDVYANAKHAFTNPNADKHNIPGVSYNKQAEERSMARMKAFFDELFK